MRYAAAIFICLVLGGCKTTLKECDAFMLDVERPKVLAAADNELVLRVDSFSALSPYKYKDMVYRKGEMEYETDYYHQFLIQPEDMIMRAAFDWFSAAGLFGDVVRWDNTSQASHSMKGYITSLYGDFQDESSFSAVVEIEITFVDLRQKKPQIVLEKTYRSKVGFESRQARSLVQSYGKCLEEIFTKLESDTAACDLQ
jgi:cholesterol transport system auxiliary component